MLLPSLAMLSSLSLSSKSNASLDITVYCVPSGIHAMFHPTSLSRTT
jgi:hypothetical protein